jgi:hypothetical protein
MSSGMVGDTMPQGTATAVRNVRPTFFPMMKYHNPNSPCSSTDYFTSLKWTALIFTMRAWLCAAVASCTSPQYIPMFREFWTWALALEFGQ